MIDEMKLIDAVEKEIEFAKKCNMPQMVAGMQQIKSVIERQDKTWKWIPADEEVPDSERNDLITREDTGKVVTGYYLYTSDTWFSNGTCKEIPVAAWMELPEAYTKTV